MEVREYWKVPVGDGYVKYTERGGMLAEVYGLSSKCWRVRIPGMSDRDFPGDDTRDVAEAYAAEELRRRGYVEVEQK